MQVTVQVSPNVARSRRQLSPSTEESEELLRVMETFALKLEPLHHNTDDSVLLSYFTVEVQDNTTAQRMIDRLQQLEAVEAAYIKPPDELP